MFPTETITIRKDSIIRTTNTVYRDTTITVTIPGDTVINTEIVYIKNGLVFSKKLILNTSLARSESWVENSVLKGVLMQRDSVVDVRIDNAIRVTWERAERFFSEKQTVVVEKKFIPLFYKIMTLIAGLFIVYYILKLIAIFKK